MVFRVLYPVLSLCHECLLHLGLIAQEVKTRECRPDAALVYDLGWIVTDGETVYERRSIIIADTFFQAAIMESAYYAEKLPQYHAGIGSDWSVMSLRMARELFAEDCETYDVRDVWAYNCSYDYAALNHSTFIYSNGFVSHFFPETVAVRDIWTAAGSTICATPKFVRWCIDNGYVSKKGNPSTTAETVYRYIVDNDFIEAHTALADCEIECEILMRVKRRKQKFNHNVGGGWRDAANIAKQMR